MIQALVFAITVTVLGVWVSKVLLELMMRAVDRSLRPRSSEVPGYEPAASPGQLSADGPIGVN
jgi:hypothetical protein